jgi:hypothetical protein
MISGKKYQLIICAFGVPLKGLAEKTELPDRQFGFLQPLRSPLDIKYAPFGLLHRAFKSNL